MEDLISICMQLGSDGDYKETKVCLAPFGLHTSRIKSSIVNAMGSALVLPTPFHSNAEGGQ